MSRHIAKQHTGAKALMLIILIAVGYNLPPLQEQQVMVDTAAPLTDLG